MKFLTRLPAVLSLLVAAHAYAGIDKIQSPVVNKGEWELEYSGLRTGDHSGSNLNNGQTHELELEYGLTDDLKIGLASVAERESPNSLRTTGLGLEAQYQMTSQKEWWLASAISGEFLVSPHENEPNAGEVKLLLQRHQKPWNLIANIGLARDFGPHRTSGTAAGSNIQAIYFVNRSISPGFEWHADYGNIDHLELNNDEGQYVGPVIAGSLMELGKGEVKYLAGYYWGLTSASANQAARAQLSYEIRF